MFPGVVTQGQPLLNGRKGKSVMGIIGMIANDMTNSLTPCDKTLATCATGNVPFQVFGIQQCS